MIDLTQRFMAAESLCYAVERHEDCIQEIEESNWSPEAVENMEKSLKDIASYLSAWKRARQDANPN